MKYNGPFDQTNPAAGYVNGNPATNTAGSIPCAEGLEYPQREIVAAIQAAGLTPTNADLTQLAQSISILALQKVVGSGQVPIIAGPTTTLYVRTDGSDANDGSANTAAKAFLTPAAAIAYGLSRFSLVGGTLNIVLGLPGTYPAPGVIPATVGTLAIIGDPANPASYILNGSTGVSPLFVQGNVNVVGARVTNNAVGFGTCTASANGFLTISNVQVNTTVSAPAHFAAGNTGIVAIEAGCSVLTGATNCMSAVTSGNIQLGASLTLANTPGFTGAFAVASSNGSIGVSGGVSFLGTGAVGSRYAVSLNGSIGTNGGGTNFFPGNAAGTNDGTGAYA